jgi:predicted phage terminase large subunit-like protein
MRKLIENEILFETKANSENKRKESYLNNLFLFAKEILGYQMLSEDIHKNWAAALSDNSIKRKLRLKPRGTYKTSLYTISYPLWKIIRNPELRIGICSNSAENACDHIRTMQKQILHNDKLINLFGKLYNKKSSWTQTGFSISSRKNFHRKENNITALGFGTQMTGKHFDIIIADDIVNNEDRESPAIRKKKARWFEDIISILEPNGEILIIGTRWHPDDFYNYIINDLNPRLPQQEKYDIEIETAINDKGEANFPSILPLSKLETLKIEKGIIEFNSQYMNCPITAGTQIFYESDFQYFNYTDEYRNRTNIAYLDPSLGKNYASDYSALIIGNLSTDSKLYIIDAVIAKVLPDVLMKILNENCLRYNIKTLGIESNSFQEYMVDEIEKKLSGIDLKITKVRNHTNKEIRIQSLQPLIKNGKILFRQDAKVVYPLLLDQLLLFPLSKNDDAPDALEGLYSLTQQLTSRGGTHLSSNSDKGTSRLW